MLAIVIPYYKLTFFEETLESLTNQTDKRFKVYIGDDASPENPTGLLDKYQGQFDFVYHRFDSNLGSISLTQQWERCIALSGDEEWIMILGDDDMLGGNVVESFYDNLEEIKLVSNVVRFASYKIDGKGEEVSLIYRNKKVEPSKNILFNGTRSSLSEYIFNKKQISVIGFKDFPLAWLSDVLAVMEFSDFKEIYSINEACVYVRTSHLNISGRQDNLEQKAKAYFLFNFYLLTQKHNCFSETQKKELQLRLNKCYINNKKEVGLFYKISKFYIINFLVFEYFKFINSIFSNSLKK